MKNKLTSMTDFVLIETGKLSYTNQELFNCFAVIRKYAAFLKLLLEKWMFLPCKLVDGVWIVLEKPEKLLFDEDPKLCALVEQYQQSKALVLFEGLDIDAVEHHIKMGRNIEYLANFGTINLTDSALKMIAE